jgi:hypothetical protein
MFNAVNTLVVNLTEDQLVQHHTFYYVNQNHLLTPPLSLNLFNAVNTLVINSQMINYINHLGNFHLHTFYQPKSYIRQPVQFWHYSTLLIYSQRIN